MLQEFKHQHFSISVRPTLLKCTLSGFSSFVIIGVCSVFSFAAVAAVPAVGGFASLVVAVVRFRAGALGFVSVVVVVGGGGRLWGCLGWGVAGGSCVLAEVGRG